MAPDSVNAIDGEVTVNGRHYKLPKRPTVVVCIDGSEPSTQTTTVGCLGRR